jgi:peptidoglycan hydrolase CwlO-like protein
MLLKKIKRSNNVLVAVAASFLMIGSPLAHAVTSQDLQQQIDTLNQQNAQNQQNVNDLNVQASSYEDAISKLDAQISTMQQQIVSNQNKQTDLQNQIDVAQAELEQQKKTLGENIKAMYLEGNFSTLEVLASSNNLSEYVNKQQYRNSVQSKVKTTLDKITALKQQLLSQKNAIDSLLAQQQSIKNQLASDQAQQSYLLALTEGQKIAFNQQIKSNNSRIAQLRSQQIALNMPKGSGALSHDPSNGYYPYAGYPFSMSLGPGCTDGDGPDRWGYCTRQCVSYAAWAVERSGRRAPMYYGNARDWVAAAYRDGVPVSTSPQAGDVAISTAGTWGHAMYVESVSGDQIYVSQYNVQLDGQYTTQWRSASGLYFLRFP